MSIGPGSRVQYKYLHKDTGTVVRPVAARYRKGWEWYVRWDHDPYAPRMLPAFEENLIELPKLQKSPLRQYRFRLRDLTKKPFDGNAHEFVNVPPGWTLAQTQNNLRSILSAWEPHHLYRWSVYRCEDRLSLVVVCRGPREAERVAPADNPDGAAGV